MEQLECPQESRIKRNELDIQTLFTELNNMKAMKIAQLSTQVATLLGVIITITLTLLKG